MFNELNRNNRTVKPSIDTKNMEFKPLKSFIGRKINVDGFFFTKGKYGEQVVVVGNGYLINMPSRSVEQFKFIENNNEMVEAMFNNHLCIIDIEEADTKNGKTTIYKLSDC